MARRPGRILVVAGTDGAGKSAIVQANASAWKLGFNALQRAINNNDDFSFETTLGGYTIARDLHQAIKAGLKIYIWYVGLASPELHIARVRAPGRSWRP